MFFFFRKPFFDEHETYDTASQQLSLICKGLNLMEEIEKVRLTDGQIHCKHVFFVVSERDVKRQQIGQQNVRSCTTNR